VRDLLDLDAQPCRSILMVEFFEGAKDRLAQLSKRKLGLRKIEVNCAEDAIGRALTIRVNGVDIFCKGANWIPADAMPATPTPRSQITRAGYSRHIIPDANENDLQSALKVYATLISDANHIVASEDQMIYDGVAEMEHSLRIAQVDIVAAPADEMLALPPELIEPPYVASSTRAMPGIEYVILVNAQGKIASLADLQGRSINVLGNSQGSLALPWLEVLLSHNHLGRARNVFAQITSLAKPSLVALPVFFQQVDACIITRSSFTTLCELNPQLQRQLRVLATSPQVFPMLSGFRRGMDPALRARIVRAITTLETNPAGRQLLTLFQAEKLIFCDESMLSNTRLLLAERARLGTGPGTASDGSR